MRQKIRLLHAVAFIAALTVINDCGSGSITIQTESCTYWNFAQDYLGSADQPQAVIPDLCGTPRWSFYDSVDLTNTPSRYKLLDTYMTTRPDCVPGTGMKFWSTATLFPSVYANANDEAQLCNGYIPLAPATAFVHPGPTSAAVVGWNSTFTGTVQVEVNLADADSSDCGGGDGVTWYVQKNSKILVSDAMPNAGSSTWINGSISVVPGDNIFVGVGPNVGGYGCDSTKLDITVTLL